jgi:hypothetical protein
MYTITYSLICSGIVGIWQAVIFAIERGVALLNSHKWQFAKFRQFSKFGDDRNMIPAPSTPSHITSHPSSAIYVQQFDYKLSTKLLAD